ncbi:hypothetical protein [Marinobacterium aestuariivivens]|uniref:Resolvase/invertase-type recombinase catalytic domain-containing protein n=1 Tax=Marinobacterium aestuariivivens TaxID=1698799 RepID=A0ABW1ZZY1_9GAMM
MEFATQLELNVRAGAPIVQIISYETLRIQACCQRVAGSLGYEFYIWNRTQGLRHCKSSSQSTEDYRQPHEIFEWLDEQVQQQEKVLLLLEDFHPDLADNQLETISRLRNFAISVAKRKCRTAASSSHSPCRFCRRNWKRKYRCWKCRCRASVS